jgi:hypothetical protein
MALVHFSALELMVRNLLVDNWISPWLIPVSVVWLAASKTYARFWHNIAR